MSLQPFLELTIDSIRGCSVSGHSTGTATEDTAAEMYSCARGRHVHLPASRISLSYTDSSEANRLPDNLVRHSRDSTSLSVARQRSEVDDNRGGRFGRSIRPWRSGPSAKGTPVGFEQTTSCVRSSPGSTMGFLGPTYGDGYVHSSFVLGIIA